METLHIHTLFSARAKRDINYRVISRVQSLFMSFNKILYRQSIKNPLKMPVDVTEKKVVKEVKFRVCRAGCAMALVY